VEEVVDVVDREAHLEVAERPEEAEEEAELEEEELEKDLEQRKSFLRSTDMTVSLLLREQKNLYW